MTTEIPDDVLNEAMRLTGASTKEQAVVSAVTEFVRRTKLLELVDSIRESDTFMTLEELMDMRMERGKYADEPWESATGGTPESLD